MFLLSLCFFIDRKNNQNTLKPLSKPYTVSLDQMNYSSDIRYFFPNISAPNLHCKERCLKYIKYNSSYQYLFKGEKFEIFGTFSPNHGKFIIYLDGKKLATINQNKRYEVGCALQYSSKILKYSQHKIELKSLGKPFKICHFSFWPSINAVRLNSSEMQINDSYSTKHMLNKKISISIKCSKVWIYGTICNKSIDQIIFSLDGKLIRNKVNINNGCDFQYETDDFQLANHKLDFQIHGNAFINCIYFLSDIKFNNINKMSTLKSSAKSSEPSKKFVIKNQRNSFIETENSEKNYNFYDYVIERKSKFKMKKIVILMVSFELFIFFSFILVVIVLLMQRMFSPEELNEFPLIIL